MVSLFLGKTSSVTFSSEKGRVLRESWTFPSGYGVMVDGGQRFSCVRESGFEDDVV